MSVVLVLLDQANAEQSLEKSGTSTCKCTRKLIGCLVGFESIHLLQSSSRQ